MGHERFYQIFKIFLVLIHFCLDPDRIVFAWIQIHIKVSLDPDL